jgi:hypothetical protein
MLVQNSSALCGRTGFIGGKRAVGFIGEFFAEPGRSAAATTLEIRLGIASSDR